MKKLDFIFLFIISLCYIGCSNPSEYKEFDLVREAEKIHSQGNLEKALDLLDQAQYVDYGSCGNSYMEANSLITDSKCRIYIEKGQYKLAREILNSSNSYGGTLDSLRIRSYQLEIGLDSLSNMIDSSLSKVTFEADNYSWTYAIIPLINGVDTIRIEATEDIDMLDQTIINNSNTDDWIADFQVSINYKMIKGTAKNNK